MNNTIAPTTGTTKPQHRGNGLGHGTNNQEGHQLMDDVTPTDGSTATIDRCAEARSDGPCTKAAGHDTWHSNGEYSWSTPAEYIDVVCTRDHCDRQGKMHRLDMSMYESEDEAREMVSHDIDLGGVFHVDCLGADGPWLFWTNHNEIFETEIEWWIKQANAAAKLCMDLNKRATA